MPAPGGGWDTEVGLDAPLAHAHRGETEVHNGHTLELRAEVATPNPNPNPITRTLTLTRWA